MQSSKANAGTISKIIPRLGTNGKWVRNLIRHLPSLLLYLGRHLPRLETSNEPCRENSSILTGQRPHVFLRAIEILYLSPIMALHFLDSRNDVRAYSVEPRAAISAVPITSTTPRWDRKGAPYIELAATINGG